MNKVRVFYYAAVSSLAGLLLSMYLTLLPPPQFCDISNFISCDAVLSSPYAKFMGIPTAFYGVVWFTVSSSSSFLAVNRKAAAKFLSAWSIVGIASVALLVYVELGLIGAVCLLCTAAHALVLAVAVFAFYGRRRV